MNDKISMYLTRGKVHYVQCTMYSLFDFLKLNVELSADDEDLCNILDSSELLVCEYLTWPVKRPETLIPIFRDTLYF